MLVAPRTWRFVAFTVAVMLVCLGTGIQTLHAATTYTVNVTSDTGTGADTTGDLRFAITQVNAGTGGDTINITAAGTIVLTSALPPISKSVVINGPGADQLSISGNNAVRVLNVTGSGTVVELHGVAIINGAASGGAGINVGAGASLTVTDVLFTGNVSTAGGGGIKNLGTTLVQRSAFLNNKGLGTTTLDGGGGITNQGALTVENSTFANNEGNVGGAISNCSTATLTRVVNSTIRSNTATTVGGVFTACHVDSRVELVNSIVAGNDQTFFPVGPSDVGGSVLVTNSIIGVAPTSGFVSNVNSFVGVDPLLGPLGNHGGPTQVFPLLPGSPAIGLGTTGAGIPADDQRGVARTGHNDAGAFQSQGFTLSVVSGNNQSAETNTPFANLVVSVAAIQGGAPFNEPVAGGRVNFTAPASGPSAVITGSPAGIAGDLTAGVLAAANGTVGGPYQVLAEAGVGSAPAAFSLSNTRPLVDVTVTKTNDIGGNALLGQGWTWTLDVASVGSNPATFESGETILLDLMPGSVVNLGTPVLSNVVNVSGTGTIECSIASGDLLCVASGGTVILGPVTGGFSVAVPVMTLSTTGAFTNPRAANGCLVDPDNTVDEGMAESNNACLDTVFVRAPDLRVTKTNNVGGIVNPGFPWTWTLEVQNFSTGDAVFADGERILVDNLPDTGVTYGAASIVNVANMDASSVSCAIVLNDLTCVASGDTVTVPLSGRFSVRFTATPSISPGLFLNPRAGGACLVDPDNVAIESQEANNTCSDSVGINLPDLQIEKSNDRPGGLVGAGGAWVWKLKVSNKGTTAASFTDQQVILFDQLPANAIYPGTPSASPLTLVGITNAAAISCSTVANDLTCKANGNTVTIAANGSFEVTFLVTQGTDPLPATYTNPRSGGTCAVDPAGHILETNDANNTCDSDTVVAVQPRDLRVTKTNNVSGSVPFGGSWIWELTILNAGPGPATFEEGQRILEDWLPSSVTYGAITTNGPGITGTISCAIDASRSLECVASEGPVTFAADGTFSVLLPATPTTQGAKVNPREVGRCSVDPDNVILVEALFGGGEDNNLCVGNGAGEFAPGDTVNVVPATIDLTASLSNNVAGATTANSPWTWTAHIANPGSGPATFADGQRMFVANLPGGTISYGAATATNPVGISGGSIVCSIASGDLSCAASGSVTLLATNGAFDVVFQATATAPGEFLVPRSGGVCAVDPDSLQIESNESNNACSDTVDVTGNADVSVTMTDSPDPAVAGTALTYTITVHNDGPEPAPGRTLSSTLPAQLSGANYCIGAGCDPTGGSTWTGSLVLDEIANGADTVVRIRALIDSATTDGVVLSNSASVSTTGDPTPANNTTDPVFTTVTTSADLVVSKSDAPDPVKAGGVITYTLNFTNAGPSVAQNVAIIDSLPAGTTFVSLQVTLGTDWSAATPAVGTNGDVIISKASVANGETATFILMVRVGPGVAGGTVVTNSAHATSATTDPDPANTAIATTTVETSADLVVTKSDSPDPVAAGASLTYTVNFTNNGPSAAQSVSVTDSIPDNTTFVFAEVTAGAGWSMVTPAAGGAGDVVFSKAVVASGETATFTIVVKVSASTLSGTIIDNVAVAASTTPDPLLANNTGIASTQVHALADLELTRTDTPDPVLAGEIITTTLNFTNKGPSDAQTVTITNAALAHTTFVSASVTAGTGWTTDAPAVDATGNVIFSKATVAPGETATFVIVHRVNSNTAHGTEIVHNAQAASATSDPETLNNGAIFTSTVQTAADLQITVTDSPDPVVAGQVITYTIQFINNGPSYAQNVTITAPLPANTSLPVPTIRPADWDDTGIPGSPVFSKAAVAPGETAMFAVAVTVADSLTNGTIITSTITAASTTSDPGADNNTAEETTEVQTLPDLIVEKVANGTFTQGDPADTFTITVTNQAGIATSGAITVTDTLPAGLAFVSGSGGGFDCIAVGQDVTCTRAAALDGGLAAEITLTVAVAPNATTPLTNTVVVACACAETGTDNNSDSVVFDVIPAPNLSVTKQPVGKFVAGANAAYLVTVTNIASVATTAPIVVTDALPAGTSFVSGTGAGWICGEVSGTVTCTRAANLAAGASTTITLAVAIDPSVSGVVTNTATATGGGDVTPANNSGSATKLIVAEADLAVTKTTPPGAVVAGMDLIYTLTLTNNGPSDAATVVIADTLPAGTTFVSVSPGSVGGWTVIHPTVGSGGLVRFEKALVPDGETVTFELTVRVSPSLNPQSPIRNSVAVTSSTADSNPANNNQVASAITPVALQADVWIEKRANSSHVRPGDNITYTITVKNHGPSDSLNVRVTDPVPNGTKFVSATVSTGSGWVLTQKPSPGGTGTVAFTSSRMPAGSVAALTIVVRVNPTVALNTPITNTATIGSYIAPGSTAQPVPDLDADNNIATVTVIVGEAPSLAHLGNPTTEYRVLTSASRGSP